MLINAVSAEPQSAPLLDRAEAIFLTGQDDKDQDTVLTVLVSVNGDNVARESGRFDRFNDRSERTVRLLITPTPRGALERGVSVVVRIDPNGDDAWQFSLRLVLHFSDGSMLTKSFPMTTLSQEQREYRANW
jgi:hypothetical protein